jgi:hypothetical protein
MACCIGWHHPFSPCFLIWAQSLFWNDATQIEFVLATTRHKDQASSTTAVPEHLAKDHILVLGQPILWLLLQVLIPMPVLV